MIIYFISILTINLFSIYKFISIFDKPELLYNYNYKLEKYLFNIILIVIFLLFL